jgi:hypothetical protein
MQPKELAEYYRKTHKDYATARFNALQNIVNRTDMYRPSNRFVDDFWFYLKQMY